MKKILIICILLINNIYSQNEDLELDSTFANNGTLVLTDIKQADHITTDSFNNIICIGKTHSNQSLALKLLPDGDIDNSFGDNGKVFFDYTIYKAFVLNGDKIILIGRQSTPSEIKIFLLNADGSFDDDFGVDGVFSHQTTEYVLPVSVFEQDNMYLITGSHGAHNIFLLKLFTDGTPDTSFGDNGLLLAPFPVDMGGESKDYKIEESAIYTFGHGYLSKFVINKYTEDGQLDSSFAGDGNIIIDESPNVNVRASSLYIHNDHILVVGRQQFPGPPMLHSYAKIFKINKNTGVFDTSFGNNGALGIGLTGGDGGSTSYSAGYSSLILTNVKF